MIYTDTLHNMLLSKTSTDVIMAVEIIKEHKIIALGLEKDERFSQYWFQSYHKSFAYHKRLININQKILYIKLKEDGTDYFEPQWK